MPAAGPTSSKPREPEAKIAAPVRRFFAEHPDDALQVLVVLDVPQPDLSFLVSPSAESDSTDVSQARKEAAEQSVADLLERHGGALIRRLPNASSLLAAVDRSTLDALAESPDVAEIVANETLR
ncbi:hypothetical protein [Marimonas arenosa]|uniref:Uncharacterized protein n=1 Tax=Marimonas arenosa TaxID=1795305 RepID=A0AAE3WFK6_9RHOB|nr:hypothetical protein [Marimonas arenosa]MDQ2091485.1 hypothetical protein [Marimonas arenosa]